MSPSSIIALVKDAAIVLAVCWLGWFVYSRGQDSVKVQDLKALEQRIIDNGKQEAAWRDDRTKADQQLASDVSHINAAPAKPPVLVCNRPASGGQLPTNTGSAAGAGSGTGGPDKGSGGGVEGAFDIRPAIDALEKKYEIKFAECRDVLAQWPVATDTH